MSVGYKLFFNLSDNFTMEQLKYARNKKLNAISLMEVSDIDKKVYAEQVVELYKKGKKELLDRTQPQAGININLMNPLNLGAFSMQMMSNAFNMTNMNVNAFSQSTSCQEIVNSDGTRTVIETTKTNNNGQIQETIKKYIKNNDGSVQPITDNSTNLLQ